MYLSFIERTNSKALNIYRIFTISLVIGLRPIFVYLFVIILVVKRPRAGDPFDTFPKNFWQEFSSPFTDTPEDEELEVTETTTHEPFPFFADPYTTINISTQLSSNVYLHCRVNDLQGKTVSWMRRKGDDLTLITFGQHTYSGDSRYSLEFEEPNDWKLLIQFANERDEGPYECQVSSHPPLVLLVYLTIIGEYI